MKPSFTRIPWHALAAAALLGQIGWASAGDLAYTIAELPTLGGTETSVHAINNAGQAVGRSQTAAGVERAFLYSGGVMFDLGTLGGDDSEAFGISSSGLVVGHADTADGYMRAFLYNSGVMSDLGTLGGGVSMAQDINDLGQIAGSSRTAGDFEEHAFFRPSGGPMSDLGTLGGTTSVSHSINSSGQAVGWSFIAGDAAMHAFVYSGGVMKDLGTLVGGTNSAAAAINDNGDVVGWSDQAGSAGNPGKVSFLYTGGMMKRLGHLGGESAGLGVNNYRQVVGRSFTVANAAVHAFLCTGSGGFKDLNHYLPGGSGWSLIEAHGINDNGQIVGYGVHNGEPRAFRMTPVSVAAVQAAGACKEQL